ncbi:tRNA (guanosine(37)-N1)-methyltransferase TrmD [Bailinhaonella thermotolerans]|uniref:tRNA (guanine-N(1)-)-methyltransferase n=1 Tax=Bailinhaonella thermotolerans TaxID=1070861 RepID=A0A3A4A7E6_9ACTN|nr:tRNA (guanosine(37)-N1)-methyltransferase TrmD [Bailinhaonella thermotolerans]RJL21789.1 tRNA (guanosine(37)-N1)-methyltransferase TrmD [Bailinhaonella thermotolerans]
MRIDIVSIFPEYFSPLDVSLIGKARARGILDIRLHQLRDWTHDVHRTVDDTPYGGGPGMVMKPEPWGEALDAIAGDVRRLDAEPGEVPGPGAETVPTLIVPTPSGRPFTQADAVRLAREPWLVFACGRYEGIDGRVVEHARTRMPVEELSIGDYVLAGGEAAVLVMIEAIGRLLPGVLGNAVSAVDDSFAPGAMESLLEGPVYTKPPEWRGLRVPDVLLSGNHGVIARWRRDQALRRTAANRPELVAGMGALDERDRRVLDALDSAETGD